MTPPPPPADDPVAFAQVLADERQTIARSRQPNPDEDAALRLAGLAFSGGGIRSATFNLGVLQGLANRGVLHAFDYLSTVSGGGYIGAWFSALLHRRAAGAPADEAAVRQLAAEELANDRPRPELTTPDSPPVRFVRRYADYLTPRLGLSGDTLALISIGIRNGITIQLPLLSLLVWLFSVMLLLALAGFGGDDTMPGKALLAVAIGLMLIALIAAVALQPDDGATPATRRDGFEPGRRAPGLSVALLVLLPALASGLIGAAGLEQLAKNGQSFPPGGWLALPMLGYALTWMRAIRNPAATFAALTAALLLGLIIFFGLGPLSRLIAAAPFGHTAALAPLAVLGGYSFVITVHLALAGAGISEQSREWWARLGGQTIALAGIWTLSFLLLLYLPPLLEYSVASAFTGGALWTGLSALGAYFGKSHDTGGNSGIPWKEALVVIAPWVFLVGLIGAVAWFYTACLLPPGPATAAGIGDLLDNYWYRLNGLHSATPAALALVASLLFLLLVRRIDLNLFSAHAFYRNRLSRTFLGASHIDREPNRFTGFDPDDDLNLTQLQGQRPIPLINANVNLTGGDDLGWQTRRGASFVFTPHYCGYATCTTAGRKIGGYRATDAYAGGDFSLATAAAVSGAAASPNMGFHTSTPVAALLTLFNLRLARWCPNPEKKSWRAATPRWGGAFLFAELLGEANGHRSWLNLSDGGHFDNLGIYELARRRAALILVCDAGADPGYRFDDLAMVKRRLWTDFGVDLHFAESALAPIRPKQAGLACPDDPRFSDRCWAFGRLRYPDGSEGVLIYLKSALTRAIPLDVRQYKDTHPSFPHESTANQWFVEDQFEAYRHLGQHLAETLLDSLLPPGSLDPAVPAATLIDILIERVRAAADPAASARP